MTDDIDRRCLMCILDRYYKVRAPLLSLSLPPSLPPSLPSSLALALPLPPSLPLSLSLSLSFSPLPPSLPPSSLSLSLSPLSLTCSLSPRPSLLHSLSLLLTYILSYLLSPSLSPDVRYRNVSIPPPTNAHLLFLALSIFYSLSLWKEQGGGKGGPGQRQERQGAARRRDLSVRAAAGPAAGGC